MNKNDLELFKQALLEALDKNLQEEEKYFAEEIQTSEKHKIEMNEILSGKYLPTSTWKLTKAKIAAILIAATLVLVGCAAVHRNEIRDFVETVYEDYISVGFENSDEAPRQIEEYYVLTYIPEGYYIKDHIQMNLSNRYILENDQGDKIIFDQTVLNGSSNLDSERGEQYMLYINGKEIYCRDYYDAGCHYIWNDGKYAMSVYSVDQIIDEETLGKIIKGIKTP